SSPRSLRDPLPISAGLAGTARLWDLSDPAKPRERLRWRHTSGVHAVAFLPDGSAVLTGSGWQPGGQAVASPAGSDYVVRVLEVRSGELRERLEGMTKSGVQGLAVSGDGHMVIGAGGLDQVVYRWRLP